MPMGKLKVVMTNYTQYKFGGLLSSNSRVYAIQLCMPGIDLDSGWFIYVH